MAAFDYSSSFAGINNAINNFGKRLDENRKREQLAALGQQAIGGDYNSAAAAAFASGDAATGVGLLKLGQTAAETKAGNQLLQSWGIGGDAAAPATPGAPGAAPSSLIQSESGGNWGAQNNAVGAGGARGHFGRLQFGQARIQDAINAGALPDGTTPQAFMASPDLQKRAEAWHFADIDDKIRANGFDRLVGQSINGVPITIDGLRAVAHLGGTQGMKRFVESGGRYNPSDANGTSLMDYLARHRGGTMVAQAGQPAAQPQAPIAQPAQPQPVPAAEPEEDVQRLERQQAASQPQPGDDPVRLRADAQYYAQSNPEASRQMLARANAIEQSRGVQVAQAPAQPGATVADAPAPGAVPAQGFAVPQGNAPAAPIPSVEDDKNVRLWQDRYSRAVVSGNDKAIKLAEKRLEMATKAAERRLEVEKPTDETKNYEQFKREEMAAGRPQPTRAEYLALKRSQNSVNVDQRGEGEYAKTVGKSLGERMDAISKEGDSARADMAILGQLRQLGGQIKNVGSGAALQGWLAERGIKVGENVSEIEAFNALVDKLTPQQRVPGTGASSDLDVKMFKSALPSLIRTPGGNAIILDTLEAVAQDKAARAAIADRALTGELKPQDAIKELRALPDPMSAFKDAQKNGFKNLPAPAAAAPALPQGNADQYRRADGSSPPLPSQAPQQAAPPMPGARQAGDGKWYVPDQNRPGKFLQVQ